MSFTEPVQRFVRLRSASALEHLLPVAEQIQSAELVALARMHDGDNLPDLLDFHEHWEAITTPSDRALVFPSI